jgi:hypothetical protein
MSDTKRRNTVCPKKHVHALNAYNSQVSKDGILYFIEIGVECS